MLVSDEIKPYSLSDAYDYAEMRVLMIAFELNPDKYSNDFNRMVNMGWECYESVMSEKLEIVRRFRRLKC